MSRYYIMIGLDQIVYDHGHRRAACPLPHLCKNYPSSYTIDKDRIIHRIDQEPNSQNTQYKQFSDFGVPTIFIMTIRKRPGPDHDEIDDLVHSNMYADREPIDQDATYGDYENEYDDEENDDEEDAKQILSDDMFSKLLEIVQSDHKSLHHERKGTRRRHGKTVRSTKKHGHGRDHK